MCVFVNVLVLDAFIIKWVVKHVPFIWFVTEIVEGERGVSMDREVHLAWCLKLLKSRATGQAAMIRRESHTHIKRFSLNGASCLYCTVLFQTLEGTHSLCLRDLPAFTHALSLCLLLVYAHTHLRSASHNHTHLSLLTVSRLVNKSYFLLDCHSIQPDDNIFFGFKQQL